MQEGIDELTKMVMAFSGSAGDLERIREHAQRPDLEVVAVAIDLTGGSDLRELHGQASAAGAVRCHVFDLRETFVQEYVLPAIQANAFVHDRLGTLAGKLVEKTLTEVAQIETAEADHGSDLWAPASVRHRVPALAESFDEPARVTIAFERGVPVAINGIALTLVELVECLSTIAAVHDVAGSWPAFDLLQAAHRQLVREGCAGTGTAHLEVFRGAVRASAPEYATT